MIEDRVEILYEIAMSIGNSLDLEKSLKESLTQILHKLNAVGIAVFPYEQEKPDLIILDLMLPKMDGYKVCGLLKNDARYARIPIILFTARAQEENVKMAEEVGADAYIMKPFEAQTLLGKIDELIKR